MKENPKYYRVKEDSMRKRLNVMIKINAKLWPKVNPVLSMNSSKLNCKLSHNNLKMHLVIYRRDVIFFLYAALSWFCINKWNGREILWGLWFADVFSKVYILSQMASQKYAVKEAKISHGISFFFKCADLDILKIKKLLLNFYS